MSIEKVHLQKDNSKIKHGEPPEFLTEDSEEKDSSSVVNI